MLGLTNNAVTGTISTTSTGNDVIYREEHQAFSSAKFHSILRVAGSTLYVEYSISGRSLVVTHRFAHNNVDLSQVNTTLVL